MKNKISEKTALETLMKCLSGIAFIRVQKRSFPPDLPIGDCELGIETPWGVKRLGIEVKDSGHTRYAREFINKTKLISRDDSTYWIFAAPFISEKTGRMLRDSGLGYFDFSGNCLISFDGVHIQKEGKENPFYTKRQFKALFTPKASRVLKVLLSHPHKHWKTEELSKESGVSIGHVYNVKKELLNREWAQFNKEGLLLVDPWELLQEWVSAYNSMEKPFSGFYSLLKPGEFEAKSRLVCQRLKIKMGLTGFSGAFRLAPFVRHHQVSLYLEDNVDGFVTAMGLRAVSSGENVIIAKPADMGVFYDTRVIDGMPVVSPVQLFLDLNGLGSRGKEAADYIFREVIQPPWKTAA